MTFKVNKRIILLSSMIVFLLLNFSCKIHFCFDTIQEGTKEVYCEKYGHYLSLPDTTTPYRWYYSSDSVLVCNVDLSSIGNDCNLNSRLFSSHDIELIRKQNNVLTHFFRIRNARYGDGSFGRCFFARVPFRYKHIRKNTYDYVIPITYLNDGVFVVHDKQTNDSMSLIIRDFLLLSMDSASVFEWEKRCNQGMKIEEHFNPYNAYIIQ